MIKLWILLSVFFIFIQYFIARKKAPHYIGCIIPLCFLCFSFYVSHQLIAMGLNMFTISAFFIPPILLITIFELVYWYTQAHAAKRM